jgi:diguanylate cyclase (GGDEF)-like protein
LTAFRNMAQDLARSRASIEHLALHDPLTGLPNRVLLNDRLVRALAHAKRHGEPVALLCLDLDHFKHVNDAFGHPVGDTLLRRVAERMRGCLRQEDTAARIGGDEFVIIQGGDRQPECAAALAHRLIETLGAGYDIDGHQIAIGTSIGIALASGDGVGPDELLNRADRALYRAKAEGRGTYRSFDPDMDAQVQARRKLEIDLRRAQEAGEFELLYQPMVDLRSGEITAFEALLRWRHPTQGMVPPAEFVPLAEEIGLIAPISEWVLHQACAAAAGWPAGIRVAVNLSAVQFRSSGLLSAVTAALQASGLQPGRLELEITETVLLTDCEATLSCLRQLQSAGMRISMDDFGTGYSSLGYLRSFPFDRIKIDRSFVREMTTSADCRAIVRAVVGLGRSLGMAVTAEGVETREQLERLRAEHCNEVQGYYLSPPVPAGQIGVLLGARSRAEMRRPWLVPVAAV